ncbi:MAG: DUF1002 domain-containing protein [Staphylococcus epidermidis]|jgi:uncharacterized protein YpuA (DUF1002 family)|nr:DUF1002 domain-containing protein [Staphylococcus epidermidis]MDU4503550.1 DUF1002 domain-containing protein [Staphylococcus warneri]MDU4694055.1 DUF1002 domain-containing protein [Dermabacter sp.]MDU6089935.1 DUF1002 domain-containing protein [Staphylococcus lugdunensis]HCY9634476.1 DUF1002 domain-containing protein [Staphylococcus aureus]
MYKKILASGLTVSMLLVGLSNANAEENQITEKTLTEGADLNQQQEKQTRDLFDVNSNVRTYKVDSEDVQHYTGKWYDTIYSSTYIEPKKFRHGVDVEIVTPDNITDVSKEQYRNAAITAGIQDANIKVGAVVETLGYGALSGIYKAYEKEGNALNEQDIKNADDEMKQLSSISKNNNEEEFSDEALNNSVAEMKQEIAKEKANDNNLSRQDVENIVDDKLKENGLNKVLSDNQINSIYNIMNNVSNSKVLNQDPKAYEQQAKKLSSDIKDKAGGLIEKAKGLNTEENRNILQKIWDAIVDFVNWLVNLIKSLF